MNADLGLRSLLQDGEACDEMLAHNGATDSTESQVLCHSALMGELALQSGSYLQRRANLNSAFQSGRSRIVKQPLNAHLADPSVHQITDVGLVFVDRIHKLSLRKATPVAEA